MLRVIELTTGLAAVAAYTGLTMHRQQEPVISICYAVLATVAMAHLLLNLRRAR